jgi:HK97 gp10 family phage protein
MAKDFKVVSRKHGLYNEFEVKGLDLLDRELERMGEELATQLGKQAVQKALSPVERRVKSNIAMAGFKGTGALRDSVRTTVYLSKKPRGIRGEVRVGVDRRGKYKKSGRRKAHYALQLEYGTSDKNPFGATPERPFMRPAFDGHERSLAASAKNALQSTILRWKLRDPK